MIPNLSHYSNDLCPASRGAFSFKWSTKTKGERLLRLVVSPFRKLFLFFIELLSVLEKKESVINYNYDQLTYNIIELLEGMKFTKFSLKEIADKLNYSKNYLCRHFKNDTNTTINQYFNNMKIAESQKLLTQSDLSIQEVSDVLHFESVQYFSLMFKKHIGISPAAWRKEFSKKKYF